MRFHASPLSFSLSVCSLRPTLSSLGSFTTQATTKNVKVGGGGGGGGGGFFTTPAKTKNEKKPPPPPPTSGPKKRTWVLFHKK